jgi:hypothetical protein
LIDLLDEMNYCHRVKLETQNVNTFNKINKDQNMPSKKLTNNNTTKKFGKSAHNADAKESVNLV